MIERWKGVDLIEENIKLFAKLHKCDIGWIDDNTLYLWMKIDDLQDWSDFITEEAGCEGGFMVTVDEHTICVCLTDILDGFGFDFTQICGKGE